MTEDVAGLSAGASLIKGSVPKLLVFIPTYRRPEALARQLQAIEALRLANRGLNIHTIVSRNEEASAQDSPFVPNTEYRSNPVNMGADINIALGFTLCDGYDFLWILSDDDFLRSTPNAVDSLPISDQYDLLVFDDSRSGTTEVRNIQAADLLRSRMGLISDVIYRVDAIRKSIPESLLNVRSCFPHLSVIAASFARQPATIRYHARSAMFDDAGSYAGECVTDYSAARTGILLTGKYLQGAERRRFAHLYARYADLSKLALFGTTGSLSSALRATFSLSPLAVPLLIVLYVARKVQSRAFHAG